MAEARPRDKALILLVTFFPQCVVSLLTMTPPVMANQIALSLGLSPQIAGVYVGLVYAGAILSSSFSASSIAAIVMPAPPEMSPISPSSQTSIKLASSHKRMSRVAFSHEAVMAVAVADFRKAAASLPCHVRIA